MIEPCWLVILARVDEDGLLGIIHRLQGVLADKIKGIGIATYPKDGTQIQGLFDKAVLKCQTIERKVA